MPVRAIMPASNVTPVPLVLARFSLTIRPETQRGVLVERLGEHQPETRHAPQGGEDGRRRLEITSDRECRARHSSRRSARRHGEERGGGEARVAAIGVRICSPER